MDTTDQTKLVLRLLDTMKRAGSPRGETQVQKTAFLLDRGLGYNLNLSFILYRYGPFSFPLDSLLGRLQSSYLIDLSPNPSGYGSTLGVTDSGENLIQSQEGQHIVPNDSIRFVADRFGRLGVVELERLATALYVTKQRHGDASRPLGKAPSADARAIELVRLKPHIAQDAARRAVDTIDEWLKEAWRTGAVAVPFRAESQDGHH